MSCPREWARSAAEKQWERGTDGEQLGAERVPGVLEEQARASGGRCHRAWRRRARADAKLGVESGGVFDYPSRDTAEIERDEAVRQPGGGRGKATYYVITARREREARVGVWRSRCFTSFLFPYDAPDNPSIESLEDFPFDASPRKGHVAPLSFLLLPPQSATEEAVEQLSTEH